MYKWMVEGEEDATSPPSHFALPMPKNGLCLTELYCEYNVYALFGSLFLQFALLFFKNVQT